MRKIFLTLIVFVMNFSFATAAQIDPAKYDGEDNLIYPVVTVKNYEAAGKINAELRGEIEKFLSNINEVVEDGFEPQAASTSFEVTCNHENGILSIIINEYVYFKKAAHPSTYRRALNFNSDSGERILADSLSEIADEENGESAYSPNNLTRKLRDYADKNNIELYRDFQRLTKVPEDFYFDENLHVHFIFQAYDVAPYAVGIIEFDATPQK